MINNEPGAFNLRTSSFSGGNGDCVEVAWRTSTRSGGSGACVEVAWRKSTHSGGSGNCVEVARDPLTSLVRDSKNPGGPILAIPTAHWRAFLRSRS